jgi:Methyltransferase domain
MFCSICGNNFNSWIIHRYSENEFFKLMKANPSNLIDYQCPECGSNSNERLLWIYLSTINGLLEQVPNLNILHIFPELSIEKKLLALGPKSYIRSEYLPKTQEHTTTNNQRISFPDNTFNLVFCNYALSREVDFQLAIKELYRCISPNGVLIAQSQFSPLLKNTFELKNNFSKSVSSFFFGGESNLRLFGSDYPNFFEDSGFKNSVVQYSDLLPDVDHENAGINPGQPFFVFYK